MKLRVPNIYIIGAQKSGTTTLYDWLAQHPQIYGHPLAKDFGFFSNLQNLQDKDKCKLFYSFMNEAPLGSLVLGGEASAMYAPSGAQHMHELMPATQLIAILREPVARAYSAYTYAVERLMEDRTFEQAINDELQGMRYEPSDAIQRDYLRHGHYTKQLHEVLRFFPKERVKVVIFEEFKADPQSVLVDIFRSVGVVEDFVPDMTIRNETRGGYRSKWLAQFTYAHPSFQTLRKIGKALIPFSARTAILRKLVEFNRVVAPKPEFPDAVRTILCEYYQKEIAELEGLLGRKITAWRMK